MIACYLAAAKNEARARSGVREWQTRHCWLTRMLWEPARSPLSFSTPAARRNAKIFECFGGVEDEQLP